MRRLVVLESPYAGDIETNVAYARACMYDSLMRGESPFASHLLLPQVLDDDDPDERAMGMGAGFAWRAVAGATVVYTDLGVSDGMKAGIADAEKQQLPVEYRQLDGFQSTDKSWRLMPWAM